MLLCQTQKKQHVAPHSLDNGVKHIDRNNNIIIFGVREDRDVTVWRRIVEDILQFIAERAVDIIDVYRLGRFNSERSKPRPIIVKLRVAWDCRLLLSNSRKLKSYNQPGIFIARDEPLDVRRQQILDRLKHRAQKAGKSVIVCNGILSIDSVATFSINEGFINSNNNG